MVEPLCGPGSRIVPRNRAASVCPVSAVRSPTRGFLRRNVRCSAGPHRLPSALGGLSAALVTYPSSEWRTPSSPLVLYRGFRADPELPGPLVPHSYALASFSSCPLAALQFACRAVHSAHFMHFTDPRTNRPYGGGDHGLRVLVIATPHPACQLIDLTGAAVKATEYEVLTCSV